MKKFLMVLFAVSVIVLMGACSKDDNAGPREDKAITIKLGFTFSPTDYRGMSAMHWAELVTEKSGGLIKFETFPSEQLVQGREALQGVSQGIIDAYMTSSTYVVGLVPATLAYDLPQLKGRTIAEMLQFTNDLMDETNDLIGAEFRKAGVEMVGVVSQSGPTEMIFSKPVRTMADFNGQKIRTVGGTTDRILQNLKASPVFIGTSEVFMGLQTGVIDGSVTTATTILSSKLYEVCPYLTQPSVSAGLSPYFVIINEDIWADLSENQQNIMKEATKETLEYNLGVYPQMLSEERDEALSMFDEVSTISPEEFQKIADTAIAPLWDEMLASASPETKAIAEIRRGMENR